MFGEEYYESGDKGPRGALVIIKSHDVVIKIIFQLPTATPL
jgi:hypothetical protein